MIDRSTKGSHAVADNPLNTETVQDLAQDSGEIDLANSFTIDHTRPEAVAVDVETDRDRKNLEVGVGEEVPDFSNSSVLSRTAFAIFTAMRLSVSALGADDGQAAVADQQYEDPFSALSVPGIEQVITVDDSIDTPKK